MLLLSMFVLPNSVENQINLFESDADVSKKITTTRLLWQLKDKYKKLASSDVSRSPLKIYHPITNDQIVMFLSRFSFMKT